MFLIVDNGSARRGKRSMDRLRGAWPNLIVVHTPIHASRLNQAEIYVSVVQRKVVRPNDFADLDTLQAQLLAFGRRSWTSQGRAVDTSDLGAYHPADGRPFGSSGHRTGGLDMTLTHRSSTRRGGLVAALTVLAMLVPAWGVAQGQAKVHAVTTCSAADYHHDARLGPEHLPNAGPLATVLHGWHRLAELSAHKYLHLYYDETAKSWRYPPLGGYLLTPDGAPITFQVTLAPGQVMDRFGSEYGSYLSPLGTPYSYRGIPPQSLDNTTTPDTCNYSRYKVLQPIPVQSGPIAPALGQPGFGTQYVLDASIFPGNPPMFNVMYLVNNGYLARVTG